jgi:serine/threonine protein kinase
LGVGAHGTVYWAHDQASNLDVAIKLMTPFAANVPPKCLDQAYHVIKKETHVFNELLARSSGKMHPNVVGLMSHFATHGSEAKEAGISLPIRAYHRYVHFFVTEFLGGGSLADVIKRRRESSSRFEEQELLEVVVSVSAGLRFLHAKGIVHRDIKPDNLVYSHGQKELKLIDFSASEALPNQEGKEMHKAFFGSVGTRGYTAPEVTSGGRLNGYGPSCDIFSLGCVLHEMLVGAVPEVELFPKSPGAKTQVTCCLPEEVSADVRRLIESMLAVDPADRPTPSDILHALNSNHE